MSVMNTICAHIISPRTLGTGAWSSAAFRHGTAFRKTHNLVEIGETCAALDPALDPLLRRAAPLTEYAWKFRYPVEPEEPTREEAEAALATAREVYEAILSRLPEEVRP